MRQHGAIGSHNRLSREAATGIEHQVFMSSLRDFGIIGSFFRGFTPEDIKYTSLSLFIFWNSFFSIAVISHGYILRPLRG